jgi:hypothetical protein
MAYQLLTYQSTDDLKHFLCPLDPSHWGFPSYRRFRPPNRGSYGGPHQCLEHAGAICVLQLQFAIRTDQGDFALDPLGERRA